MKRKLLTFITLMFCLFMVKAVPLTIVNNSHISTYEFPYEAHAYLGFFKEGDSCAADEILYFIFDIGSVVQINDGNFMYTDPFNNSQTCLASILDSSGCSAMPLDYDGQRFWMEVDSDLLDNSVLTISDYLGGLIGLSTGSVDCEPSSFPTGTNTWGFISTSYSNGIDNYELESGYTSPTDNFDLFKISYKKYGNVLAVLSYE